MSSLRWDLMFLRCVQYWPAAKNREEVYGGVGITVESEEQLANFMIRFQPIQSTTGSLNCDRHLVTVAGQSGWARTGRRGRWSSSTTRSGRATAIHSATRSSSSEGGSDKWWTCTRRPRMVPSSFTASEHSQYSDQWTVCSFGSYSEPWTFLLTFCENNDHPWNPQWWCRTVRRLHRDWFKHRALRRGRRLWCVWLPQEDQRSAEGPRWDPSKIRPKALLRKAWRIICKELPPPSSFVNSKFYANSKESIKLSLGEQLDLGEKLMEIYNLVFARVSGEQHCVKTSIEEPSSNNFPFQQHYHKFLHISQPSIHSSKSLFFLIFTTLFTAAILKRFIVRILLRPFWSNSKHNLILVTSFLFLEGRIFRTSTSLFMKESFVCYKDTFSGSVQVYLWQSRRILSWHWLSLPCLWPGQQDQRENCKRQKDKKECLCIRVCGKGPGEEPCKS